MLQSNEINEEPEVSTESNAASGCCAPVRDVFLQIQSTFCMQHGKSPSPQCKCALRSIRGEKFDIPSVPARAVSFLKKAADFTAAYDWTKNSFALDMVDHILSILICQDVRGYKYPATINHFALTLLKMGGEATYDMIRMDWSDRSGFFEPTSMGLPLPAVQTLQERTKAARIEAGPCEEFVEAVLKPQLPKDQDVCGYLTLDGVFTNPGLTLSPSSYVHGVPVWGFNNSFARKIDKLVLAHLDRLPLIKVGDPIPPHEPVNNNQRLADNELSSPDAVFRDGDEEEDDEDEDDVEAGELLLDLPRVVQQLPSAVCTNEDIFRQITEAAAADTQTKRPRRKVHLETPSQSSAYLNEKARAIYLEGRRTAMLQEQPTNINWYNKCKKLASETIALYFCTFDGQLKIPLGYVHSSGISNTRLWFLLCQFIALIYAVAPNVHIRALTCDNTSAVRLLMRRLACDGQFPDCLLLHPLAHERTLAFIPDLVHLMKLSRNHLSNSISSSKTCTFTKTIEGLIYEITWDMLHAAYRDFVSTGTASAAKLTPAVFYLTNQSKMREQWMLRLYDPAAIRAFENYAQIHVSFRGCVEYLKMYSTLLRWTKRREPLRSEADLQPLDETIQWLQDWLLQPREIIEPRPKQQRPPQHMLHLLKHLRRGLNELIRWSEEENFKVVLPEISQNVLEWHFGQERAMARKGGNLTCEDIDNNFVHIAMMWARTSLRKRRSYTNLQAGTTFGWNLLKTLKPLVEQRKQRLLEQGSAWTTNWLDEARNLRDDIDNMSADVADYARRVAGWLVATEFNSRPESDPTSEARKVCFICFLDKRDSFGGLVRHSATEGFERHILQIVHTYQQTFTPEKLLPIGQAMFEWTRSQLTACQLAKDLVTYILTEIRKNKPKDKRKLEDLRKFRARETEEKKRSIGMVVSDCMSKMAKSLWLQIVQNSVLRLSQGNSSFRKAGNEVFHRVDVATGKTVTVLSEMDEDNEENEETGPTYYCCQFCD